MYYCNIVHTPIRKRAILSRIRLTLPHTSHTSSHTHDTLKPYISVIFIDLRLKLIQGTNVIIPNWLVQNFFKSANLRFKYINVLFADRFYGVSRRFQRQNVNRGSRSIFDLQPINNNKNVLPSTNFPFLINQLTILNPSFRSLYYMNLPWYVSSISYFPASCKRGGAVKFPLSLKYWETQR